MKTTFQRQIHFFAHDFCSLPFLACTGCWHILVYWWFLQLTSCSLLKLTYVTLETCKYNSYRVQLKTPTVSQFYIIFIHVVPYVHSGSFTSFIYYISCSFIKLYTMLIWSHLLFLSSSLPSTFPSRHPWESLVTWSLVKSTSSPSVSRSQSLGNGEGVEVAVGFSFLLSPFFTPSRSFPRSFARSRRLCRGESLSWKSRGGGEGTGGGLGCFWGGYWCGGPWYIISGVDKLLWVFIGGLWGFWLGTLLGSSGSENVCSSGDSLGCSSTFQNTPRFLLRELSLSTRWEGFPGRRLLLSESEFDEEFVFLCLGARPESSDARRDVWCGTFGSMLIGRLLGSRGDFSLRENLRNSIKDSSSPDWLYHESRLDCFSSDWSDWSDLTDLWVDFTQRLSDWLRSGSTLTYSVITEKVLGADSLGMIASSAYPLNSKVWGVFDAVWRDWLQVTLLSWMPGTKISVKPASWPSLFFREPGCVSIPALGLLCPFLTGCPRLAYTDLLRESLNLHRFPGNTVSVFFTNVISSVNCWGVILSSDWLSIGLTAMLSNAGLWLACDCSCCTMESDSNVSIWTTSGPSLTLLPLSILKDSCQ